MNEEVKVAEATQPDTTKPEAESLQEINWAKFREQRAVERKQKEDAEKIAQQKSQEAAALKAALETLVNKGTGPQENSGYEESEDERIQKKIDAALANERRRVDQERAQQEQQSFPTRLVQAHPDFNEVCSESNLDYLEYHYPEVAGAFKNAPEGFDKWAGIYKAVKRFVPVTNTKKDIAKAEKNFTKPQSMSVGGTAQTGDHAPQMLTDSKRKDNWARMQRVMKGVQ